MSLVTAKALFIGRRAAARYVASSAPTKRRRPVVHVPQNREKTPNRLLTAGLPLILFSILSAWVVSNALEGKNKEREVSRGTTSISLRQAQLQDEHDEMMETLNKIVQLDYDNTKRVKRPEEILEERRREREKRNVWYRRWWRSVRGEP